MLKRFIAAAALTGLAAFGFASASFATPTTGPIVEGSREGHVLLVEAIRGNGVSVLINHLECGKYEGVNGLYDSTGHRIIVCQDNGVPGGPVVGWTSNDLNTLRHEAQHMIQDCVAGTNHDQHLAPVYHSPSALAQDILGDKGVTKITKVYRGNGASDLIVLLEYEAFAVAQMNIPVEQATDVSTYCRN